MSSLFTSPPPPTKSISCHNNDPALGLVVVCVQFSTYALRFFFLFLLSLLNSNLFISTPILLSPARVAVIVDLCIHIANCTLTTTKYKANTEQEDNVTLDTFNNFNTS